MRRIPVGTTIQTILFDRHKWSPEQARKWVQTHGYKGAAKQSSGQVLFYRFTQSPVSGYEKKSFRTIDLDPRYGVKAVVGLPKGGTFIKNSSPKERIKKKRNRRSQAPQVKTNPCKKFETNPKAKIGRFPVVLVYLGRALELHNEEWGFRWSIGDRMNLYTGATAKELYILKVSKRPISKGILIDALEKYKGPAKKALAVYKKWHDFESTEGTIIDEPKGEFRPLGRAKAIVYVSDKWTGKETEYVHEFKALPMVSSNETKNPTAVILRGGKLRVTAEGIKG